MAARSESLSDMAASYLNCRDKGHHWTHRNDQVTSDARKRVSEVTRWYQCAGCGTEMEEIIAFPSCEIVKRRYTYSDGYLLAKGALGPGERLSVRDVRREVFARVGIGESPKLRRVG